MANWQTCQLIVFRDPQNRDYNSRITLEAGAIAPLAFSDLAVAVAAIISP